MVKNSRNCKAEQYDPLIGKSVRNIIVSKVRREYGFYKNKKIAEIFVDDLLNEISKHSLPISALRPGQMLWTAVHEDEFTKHKPIAQHHLIPVILTVTNEEEIEKLRNGADLIEIRKNRIARLLKEAQEQKGILGLNDISLILGYSRSVISEAAREYQLESNNILPTRGVIHDLGPTVTHKAIIIKLYLQGYLTGAISKMTCHSPKSVDKYVKDFEKVKLLYGRFNTSQIAAITNMSPSLIKQHEDLIKEYLAEKLPDTKITGSI